MSLKSNYLLFVISVLFNSALYSQTYSFKTYTNEQVNAKFIYDIDQDELGNLYLATSIGIIKYDGIKFKTFSGKNGLEGDFIDKIYTDKNTVWFSYYNGGFGYVKDNRTIILNEVEFVNTITQSNDQVYIHTQQNKYIYSKEVRVDSLVSDVIISATLSSGTNIILDKEQNLFLSNKATKTFVSETKQVAYLEDANVVFYINNDSLSVLKVDNNANYTLISKINLFEFELEITSLLANNNKLYITSSNNGLVEFIFNSDYKSFTTHSFSMLNGLPTNFIETSFLDSENNLWFGTYGEGIVMLPYSRISELNYNEQININQIRKLNSKLVFATDKGLYELKRKTYTLDRISLPYNIISLHNYNDGLLVGTENNGLFFYTNDKLTPFYLNSKQVPKTIYCIRSDANSIYLGTNSGLYIITGDKTQQITTNEGLAHNIIENFIIDESRTFWFASPNSPIYSYQDGEFNYFKNVDGFMSFNITDMKAISNNEIIIATAGDGIFRYKNDQFFQINKKDGLFNDIIYFIDVISTDEIVLGHKGGLSILNSSTKTIRTIEDVEELDFILPRSNYFTGINSLWIGTSTGLVNIPTKNITTNIYSPPLTFENIIIDADTLLQQNKIELPYGDYHFEFNFKSIQLSKPSAVSYKYKLLGFDKTWTETSYNLNQARYQTLKNGNYKFIVKQFINHKYTGKQIEVNISINNPFWLTYWFYIAILIFIITLVLIIITIINKRNLKIRKLLITKVDQRTSLLNNKNKELKSLSIEYLKEKKFAEYQTREIHKSLNYASTIQKGLFRKPDYGSWFNFFNGGFIIFKPKDRVSGDFYWGHKENDDIYIAIGDCTGHGVPGAMISILGTSILNELIRDTYNTSGILNKLKEKIIFLLGQDNNSSSDGMDIALIKINTATLKAQSSSAYNPIYVIRKTELEPLNDLIIKEVGEYTLYSTFANKQPVGKYEKEKPFAETEIQLLKNDQIYMFSDGYQDQFGGEKNKKFLRKRFIDLLLSLHDLPQEKQKEILTSTLNNWMGEREQVDDITLFGLKI